MQKEHGLYNATLLFIVCIAFLISSCELFEGEDEKPKELIPLEVGNYWDYHRWYISPNIADTIREIISSKHKLNIEGDSITVYGYQRVFSGSTAQAKMNAILVGEWENISPMYLSKKSDPEYQWLRANGDEGVVSYGGISPTDTLLLKAVQYPFPTSAGQKVDHPTPSYSFKDLQFSIQDTITIETVGINETFESEWATWKGCHVYMFSEMGKDDALYWWNHYVYIKPNIGVVAVETRDFLMSEDYENNPRIIGQWILIDSQLNQ